MQENQENQEKYFSITKKGSYHFINEVDFYTFGVYQFLQVYGGPRSYEELKGLTGCESELKLSLERLLSNGYVVEVGS